MLVYDGPCTTFGSGSGSPPRLSVVAGASELGTPTIGAKSTTPTPIRLATGVRYIIDSEMEGVVLSSMCNRGRPNWGAYIESIKSQVTDKFLILICTYRKY